MKKGEEGKLLFCFAIYVLLFIGIALFPLNRNMFGNRIPIIETLYASNLIYPFIANTILTVYFILRKSK